MQAKRILSFLDGIKKQNSREWFTEHKEEYNAVRADFEEGISAAILRISEFDSSVKHLTVKDTTYRFYRDTRFSTDKSPYKTYLGAYIAAHGKKAFHGGYYIHLEPGHCLVSCGNYWLPTNILTSCRNEIMANIDQWRKIVESKTFVETFGHPGGNNWDSPKGFGLESLKTAPSGFPRDYEFIQYIRMKDYCCWKAVPDSFFEGDKWLDDMSEILKIGKPMMDFINSVIDDYE
ncbi:putative uncharacterized protein [Prevotella sp. CAG:1058]|mgnify:FL=1|nr:putative uncharacterized protein [Prevotella sp. CAG:1058]